MESEPHIQENARPDATKVVIDTNVFVAAGFRRQSASAKIVERVREKELRLVWDKPTHNETRHIIDKIPRLCWSDFAELFRDDDRFQGETEPANFDFIPDPDDRKFAALAAAAGAVLITSDQHLRGRSESIMPTVASPSEFWEV